MNYPVLALIITNIIWGAASPIFKFALDNIPPFTLAFLRFFLAAFIFLIPALKRWKKINFKDFLIILVASFFGISLHITFFFLGLLKGESINAPIIGSAGPIFLYIAAIALFKERPSYKILSGLFLSLLGVFIIIFSPIFLDGVEFITSQISSNIFFVLSTAGIVISPLICRKVLKRVNPFQFTFISFVFAATTFFPLSLKELELWSFWQLNINGWVGILYGVLFSSSAAYFLFYWGISKIKAQEIGIFSYIDPVAALLIAVPLLGEMPSIYYFAGSFLVFLGIFVAEGRIHWHPLHRLKK